MKKILTKDLECLAQDAMNIRKELKEARELFEKAVYFKLGESVEDLTAKSLYQYQVLKESYDKAFEYSFAKMVLKEDIQYKLDTPEYHVYQTIKKLASVISDIDFINNSANIAYELAQEYTKQGKDDISGYLFKYSMKQEEKYQDLIDEIKSLVSEL